MTVHASPERALLAAFEADPDRWREYVIAFLHTMLGDLVEHCATWYGTEPSPTTLGGKGVRDAR